MLCLVTWVVLHAPWNYSVPYETGMSVVKHDIANNIGQRQVREESHNDTGSGRNVTLDLTKTAAFKDGNTTLGNSTHNKHGMGTIKTAAHSSERRTDNDDGGAKVVFFLGGGKSGSTTLATYLKHDPNNWTVWDPNGQFLEGGKEFCWSKSRRTKEQFWKHFSTQGSKTAVFALDACPQAVERAHFERMVKTFPNASYLMLVRDPVDRVISHMNDMNERNNRNIDSLLKSQMNGNQLAKRLSMFGNIIQNAYSVLPKHKILIIPSPEMTRRPQETIDKVMKHIGAQPKIVTLVEANKRKHRKTYQIPSDTTIKWLKNIFYKDWELFKNTSGLRDIETVYM